MHSDQTKLRQALFNLLSNACKFTENGRVDLAVERETREGRSWLRFSVRDTGIGMSPEAQSRVFDEFTQADSSTASTYGGTGLGLAIAQKMCRLMGGDIHVESELGSGTTFRIEVPAEVPRRRRPGRSKPQQRPPRQATPRHPRSW